MENLKSDLISRKALLSKMFPYGMPDNGNYGINARAVRDAVVGAKAVEAEPVIPRREELSDLLEGVEFCDFESGQYFRAIAVTTESTGPVVTLERID